ncbi:hypothetical protein LSCM1_06311 [Leishmania martiniquensis]|uniref:Uncharacterized protein n=1 Tax=Leishmania martiniquensis TaxID=1580590 RepID=A0A836KPE9_9TRYP|nr:hypothetical protein LSCM1_06311 [Leishmania martiniquensis]
MRAGPSASPRSTLDIADHLSDGGAGAVRSMGLTHAQQECAAVTRGAPIAGSIFEDESERLAPSDDKDLVDSPRQHYTRADNASALHASPLTAAGEPVDSAFLYTPDALIVKAAQCYEQWRQCLVKSSVDDNADADGHSAWGRDDSDRGSSTEENDRVCAAVRGIRLPDSPAREEAGTPYAVAPNEATSALSPTPADDKSCLLSSHRSRSRPNASLFFSPACTRGKECPSGTNGTHSRIHSLEATAHGLTSGRREGIGDTGSTITAPAELQSLSTWMRTPLVSKATSPHVASTTPTARYRIRRLDEEAADPVTVESGPEMRVEGHGAGSQGTRLPPQQRLHQPSLVQTCPCPRQQAGMHAGVATSSGRYEPVHRKYMREDVRIVDEAAGSLQSPTLTEADVSDAHSAAPLSLVYRRLFTDEGEDSDGGVASQCGVAGVCHRERDGAASSHRALDGRAPCLREGGDGQSPSDAPDTSYECQHGTTAVAISDAAGRLTAWTEGDQLCETVIELSSSGSACSDPVEGVDLIEDEIASHFEVGLDQRMRAVRGAASLNGNGSSRIFRSASHLSLPSSAGSTIRDKRDGGARAELTDSGVHTNLAATAGPLPCRDHPLWRKHHAIVSMQYASQLLPSEQANDELLLFLCWAQEKAEWKHRWRQYHHSGHDIGSSETVFGASVLEEGQHMPCVVSEVYKLAYAAARRGRWARGPPSQAPQDDAGSTTERGAAVGAVLARFSSAQATATSCQQRPHIPHPGVFVAAPVWGSEAALSPPPAQEVEWTLTPSAAPSRFVEWIATEVDPYDGLLFSPL